MRDFELIAPASKAELLALIADADEETRVIAGGTGLVNLMRQRLASPSRLVSLHRLADMSGIEWNDDKVTIGALTRLIDVERDPGVASRLGVLRDVLHEVASPRIRSMATLGGALAHADPNQDAPLALMALDASITAESSKGSATYAMDGFCTDYYETVLAPGELITAIDIPRPNPTSRFAYKKFTPGSAEDYACVGVCIRIDVGEDGTCSGSRVVLGSVGPTVFRASDAEAALEGQRIDPDLAARAAEAAMAATDPVDDARGSATYKREMVGVWVKRLLLDMA